VTFDVRSFEGDLIRPLGLVTLYFGYAEFEIDELVNTLSATDPDDLPSSQSTVSQKLLEPLLAKMNSGD
jgi:hypothetical protein